MDDLPTLPRDRARLLELEWEELQGEFCSTGTAQAKQTADLAEARFDQIAREHWTIWKASGEPLEVFRQWLASIKSLVLTEVDDFWQTLKADWGEPDSGIRYDCNWPAVKAALSQTVGRWRQDAARLARQRLEPGYPASGDKSLNHWGEWAFRLSQSPCCEPGEYPVNGDIRRVNVPDSAIEENITAKAERANARKSIVEPILERRGWSIPRLVDEIAAKSEKDKVDYNTIDNYLNGKTNPRKSTRGAIAKALGISAYSGDPGGLPD